MTELIKNAWLGWKYYIDDGKLAAVFLTVLLFLWFGKKKVEQKALLLYTTVMTVCCIVPVTAAVLMAYQTRFYDYEWVWSMVPVTTVTGWGLVLFLSEAWTDFRPELWRKGLPVTGLTLVLVLLCGNMGAADAEHGQKEDRLQVCRLLEQVREVYPGEKICLWAPGEIMEYVREADASVLLPYGRDMWDLSLNGYTYDTYDDKLSLMYHWMEELGAGSGAAAEGGVQEEAGPGEEELPEICTGYALEKGVTCILIPETAAPETAAAMEKALHVEAQKLEGYWIFYGWAD